MSWRRGICGERSGMLGWERRHKRRAESARGVRCSGRPADLGGREDAKEKSGIVCCWAARVYVMVEWWSSGVKSVRVLTG